MGQIVIIEKNFRDVQGGGILYSLRGNWDPKPLGDSSLHQDSRQADCPRKFTHTFLPTRSLLIPVISC